MQNRIYKYFFTEFLGYFAVVLFAVTAIIWTIQAVNFLDLVTDDGHAFKIYLFYSFLTVPKVVTKLIPFTFLIALIITVLKFEKDNELIILWTSGLNKINIVNLVFRISILIMFFQLVLTSLITPQTLNKSRDLIKNSDLQFVPSLLKEKQFNDTIEGLTIFVNKKKENGEYENIFIVDEGANLTNVYSGTGSSTIFAKKGFVSEDEKNLILINGSVQTFSEDGTVNIINFDKTAINLSGLSTKTISEPKIQETSTVGLIKCLNDENANLRNCNRTNEYQKDIKIEVNKRFGMPIYIPLISLIVCFLLTSRKEKKMGGLDKYFYFTIGFIILISSEITVRYSGVSTNHAFFYYFIPVGLLPVVYLFLLRTFKYENLR